MPIVSHEVSGCVWELPRGVAAAPAAPQALDETFPLALMRALASAGRDRKHPPSLVPDLLCSGASRSAYEQSIPVSAIYDGQSPRMLPAGASSGLPRSFRRLVPTIAGRKMVRRHTMEGVDPATRNIPKTGSMWVEGVKV